MLILLLLVPWPEAQDGANVRELLRQLDDDSSEVRERATKALSALEPEALPLLQDAAATASSEAKPRLHRAIRQLENRRVLRLKLRPASLVTIDARDQPLRQVFDDLAKQGGTPIRCSGVPKDEKVTIALSKIPFWDALDGICRAHGDTTYEVEWGEIHVRKGDLRLAPHRFSGPLAVFLNGAEAPRAEAEFTLRFLACWEHANKPDGLTMRFLELKDDRGTVLLGEDGGLFAGRSGKRSEGCYELTLRSRTVPDARATKLARLSARVGFEFILRAVTLEFKGLALTSGQKLASEGVSVQLDKFEDAASQVSGSLTIALSEARSIPSDLIAIMLKDDGGTEVRVGVGDLEKGRLQVGFSAGGGPQKFGRIAELRVTVPTEIHSESIDLDLRDIPLKR